MLVKNALFIIGAAYVTDANRILLFEERVIQKMTRRSGRNLIARRNLYAFIENAETNKILIELKLFSLV